MQCTEFKKKKKRLKCTDPKKLDIKNLNKHVLDYYAFVDLFYRHCKANLNVEIIIYDNLALQFNLTKCDILKELDISYIEKFIN